MRVYHEALRKSFPLSERVHWTIPTEWSAVSGEGERARYFHHDLREMDDSELALEHTRAMVHAASLERTPASRAAREWLGSRLDAIAQERKRRRG